MKLPSHSELPGRWLELGRAEPPRRYASGAEVLHVTARLLGRLINTLGCTALERL